MERLVIIGAGMAASRLLTELARYRHELEIHLIGEEAMPCYNRVLLSSLLADEQRLADTCLIEQGWYEANGINLRSGEKVTEIDSRLRQVVTDKNLRLDYDQLILATGSVPFVPPIPGTDAENVLTFRNMADLERLRQYARSGLHATVVGGGLLGLEAAYGLRKLGLDVTVINRESWLMPKQLSEPAARILQKRLEQQHIDFELGVTPTALVTEAGRACAVSLDNQRQIETDLVLVAAGIKPNISLAESTDILCDRGILIDRQMRTSLPGVYALGECAQLQSSLFGLVEPVYQQAAVLAENLCGQGNSEFRASVPPTQLKISGVEVFSGGRLDSPLPSGLTEQILCDDSAGIFRRLLFEKDRLVGYELVGDGRNSAAYARLVKNEEAAADLTDLMFYPRPCQGAHTQTKPGEHVWS